MPDSITIPATGGDLPLEITIRKTGDSTGSIQVRVWDAGDDPAHDDPTVDQTEDVDNLRASEDGSRVRGRLDVIYPRNLRFTITVRCPEEEDPNSTESPSITIVLTFLFAGRTRRRELGPFTITRADQNRLKTFIRDAQLPRLARAGDAAGEPLGFYAFQPALQRAAATLREVAGAIETDARYWDARSGGLAYIAMDPGVEVDLATADAGLEVRLRVPLAAPERKAPPAPLQRSRRTRKAAKRAGRG